MRLQILSSLALQLFVVAAGAQDKCILAFPRNDHGDRILAKQVLSERTNQAMTPDIARKAMDSGDFVRVQNALVLDGAHEGEIVAVERRGFRLMTREGRSLDLEFGEVQFQGALSKDARAAWLKKLMQNEPAELQGRINAALEAQRAGHPVEIRIPVQLNGISLTTIYRGRIRLVEATDVWMRNEKGLLKRPDQISIFLDSPSQEIELSSGNGKPPIRDNSVKAPASIRNNFALTGDGAIQAENFRILSQE